MIRIIGAELYQWDTGRSVEVTTEGATHAHFANVGDAKAPIIELVDGKAKIPDYLFQTGKQLCVYAVSNGITIEKKVFPVTKRERPENYVYEEDQRNYIYKLIESAEEATEEAKNVAEELRTARDNGEFTGPKGDTGPKGEQGEPGIVNIDDTKIGADAWSSKNIIDRLCPGFTESGSVVTCEPLEGYPLNVTPVVIEPVINDDGWKDNSNWIESGFEPFGDHNEIYYTFDEILPAGTYTVKYQWLQYGNLNFDSFYLQEETEQGRWENVLTVNTRDEPTEKQTFNKITGGALRIMVIPMIDVLANINPQELFGTFAIYSGTDVPSGETATKITQCGKNLFSTTLESGTWNFSSKTKNANANYGRTAALIQVVPGATYRLSGTATHYWQGNMAFYDKSGKYLGDSKQIYTFTTFTTPNDAYYMAFHSPLSQSGVNFNINGTVQLEFGKTATAYEPFKALNTYTPGEAIPALSGINTLWADVGEITVEGRKDPVAEMEKLKKAILDLGGNI